jgi:stage III sporulation protein AF
LNVLSDMVRNIVVLIILVTLLDLVLPRNDFRPFVHMVVGLVLMLMLLAPLRSVLQFPGALDPVLEMQLSISEADVEARQRMLEQMNWDLTLKRYRETMEEKVAGILAAGGLAVVSLEMDLEEDVNHLEFGRPLALSVTAQPAANSGSRVERVRIEIGSPAVETETASRDSAMERKLAEALGMSMQNVRVDVLNR